MTSCHARVFLNRNGWKIIRMDSLVSTADGQNRKKVHGRYQVPN
ncbi:hypothetical protein J2S07_002546 [Robertmurraya andreesenii]|uniref:Uncharacterized protein n=1 Tax=Anoxybacillus andreesenii TaxID=1325932 RepID=A0ABT9V5M8_9BACL|nr:hypothetical protein [Robertmurraya andreesenii]